MTNSWSVELAPSTKHTTLLGKTMYTLVPIPGIQTNVSHFFSLYKFLLEHVDEPADQLAPRITQAGKPMFSVADLEDILKAVRQQKTSRLSAFLAAQKGGTGKADKPIDEDTQAEFWDKVMAKISHPVTSAIPPSWDGILWYLFIPYHLEQMEFIGPLIGTAMDAVTLSLPVAAELVKETFATLVSLAPIPYASFLGDAIGYLISLAIISFGIVLNTTRKRFGSGFKLSLLAFPAFGDALMDAAQSVEIGANRYIASRKKFLKSVDKISPHAEDFLDYWSPDVDIHEGPSPPFSIPLVKADVAMYAAEQSGLSRAMNAATNAVKGATNKATNAFKGATNKATNAVKGATNKATNAVKRATNKATNKKGGSKKFRSTRKWRR